MLGFYRAVVKLRAYLLHRVGSAAKEKTRFERWQISSRFARTKPARDASQLFQYALFKDWRLTAVIANYRCSISYYTNAGRYRGMEQEINCKVRSDLVLVRSIRLSTSTHYETVQIIRDACSRHVLAVFHQCTAS
jgi:hypothetical protein